MARRSLHLFQNGEGFDELPLACRSFRCVGSGARLFGREHLAGTTAWSGASDRLGLNLPYTQKDGLVDDGVPSVYRAGTAVCGSVREAGSAGSAMVSW